MINVSVYKKNSQIVTLEVVGHSGYAESGKDIVCSAVSAISETAALGLEKVLNLAANIVVDEKTPLLKIDLSALSASEIKKAQTIMQTAYLGLKEVASGYKKYIKIKEK